MEDRNIAALEAISSAPAITINGVTVLHNAVPWRVCKNRHSTTDGQDWGWIEGAPGNVCWENRKFFDRNAAHEMVQRHQEWLEDQKPLAIKLIEAREAYAKAKSTLDSEAARYIAAKAAFTLAEDRLLTLHSTTATDSD